MIRQARESDLKEIAIIHTACFPKHFSTLLGKRMHLLEKLYYEYLHNNPELFFVAENNNGDTTGFCVGYYCEKNDYHRLFLKHNFFSICLRYGWLLLSFRPKAWNKIWRRIHKSKETILNQYLSVVPENKRGDLLSICVLPEYRGDGSATDLIQSFEEELKKHNREACLLTVENSNERGVSFYKKNGYLPYKTIGDKETVLFRFLSNGGNNVCNQEKDN